MTSPLENVLKRVAAGELSPEEALPLIDGGISADQAPVEPPPGTSTASDPEPGSAAGKAHGPAAQGGPGAVEDILHEPGSGHGVDDEPFPTAGERPRADSPRAVRVLAAYRMINVVGDPTVARVHVTGRHTVREDGDLLIVDGNWHAGHRREEGEDPGPRFAFTALPRSLSWAAGWTEDSLTVRINPELPIEIDTTGSSLRISGLECGGRLRLLGSSLKADRFRGPLDVDARTSSIKGSLSPTGDSRIVAEQSSVKVTLLPGTSLRLTATNRMGKVTLPGRVSKDGVGFGETVHSQVGRGEGTLAVESVMSSVVIATEGFQQSR
jgi:hypothetical protein